MQRKILGTAQKITRGLHEMNSIINLARIKQKLAFFSVSLYSRIAPLSADETSFA